MRACQVGVFSVVLLAVFSSPGFAQGSTFRNEEFKFRFVYPGDWQSIPPHGPNTRALIQAPTGHLSNCNIVVRRIPQLENFTRQQIIEESFSTIWSEEEWQNALGSKFANATIHERRLTKADNYPVQFSVIDMTYETVSGQIYMVADQFVTMTPGILWHFGCGAGGKSLEEARRNYNTMHSQFLAILSSFVFEKALATTPPTPTEKPPASLDEQIKAHNAKVLEETKKRCLMPKSSLSFGSTRSFTMNPLDAAIAEQETKTTEEMFNLKCQALGILRE